MSKPDDIPQDVWDAAVKQAKACREQGFFSQIPEPLARALMAERERCASVLDKMARDQEATNEKYPEHAKAYPTWGNYVFKLKQAATAIRKGGAA